MDNFAADTANAIISHKWIPLAALAIGFLVRFSKSDLVGPSIPARVRPWLALGLGALSGILEKVASHALPWNEAVLGGLLSAVIAISSHQAFIEGVGGGKEIPTPRFLKKKPKTPGVVIIDAPPPAA